MASSGRESDSMRNADLEGNEINARALPPQTNVVVCNEAALLNPVKTRFYPGDVVLLKEGKELDEWIPLFGNVLKSAEGCEMAMGSQMKKTADNATENGIYVHWDCANNTDGITLTQPHTVSLVDRVLLRGQKVENHKREVGTVVDYEICATVLINGTDKVVKNVPLSRLRPVSPYVLGEEVLLKGWIGMIASIKWNFWFKMGGGCVFYAVVHDTVPLDRVDPYWGVGVACKGMRMKLPVFCLKHAIWTSRPMRFLKSWLPISRLFSFCHAHETIIWTDVMELEVKWLRVAPGSSEYVQRPRSIVTKSELSELTLNGTPSTETIGINSVRHLEILPEDDHTNYNDWLEWFKNKFVNKMDSPELPNPDSHNTVVTLHVIYKMKYTYLDVPVKVLLLHNVVTVEWKDGSLEKIPAIEIPKVYPIVDHIPNSMNQGRDAFINILNRTAGFVLQVRKDYTSQSLSRQEGNGGFESPFVSFYPRPVPRAYPLHVLSDDGANIFDLDWLNNLNKLFIRFNSE